MEPRDKGTITLRTSILIQLLYNIPLGFCFLYFSQLMLYGPCSLSLPGVKVTQDFVISFLGEDGNAYLQGHLDFQKSEEEKLEFCSFEENHGESSCFEVKHNQRFKIVLDETDSDVSCFQVRHEGLRCGNQMVKDCFSLASQHWYGGFESFTQVWPLKKASARPRGSVVDDSLVSTTSGVQLNFGPYVSGDFGVHKSELENVLERLFISSAGVGILVSKDSPLYLSFNEHGDQKLCLAASYDNAHYTNPLGQPPVLEYTVCKADNVRHVQTYMQNRFIQKPEDVPNLDIFKRPIWSTWAQFNKDVNQSAVLDFAGQISQHKFPCSQLEIDDDWTPHYGDLEFDPVKFPNPRQMVEALSEQGFHVTLWVHPFFNIDSAAFLEAQQNSYTVQARGSNLPALLRWWNGELTALLDVTNPAAALWYLQKLGSLREKYNVSSFKFDGGEALYVPHSHHTARHMASTNDYSTHWADLAFNSDPTSRRQEVRTAWNSQKFPIFTRLMDRLSTWDEKGGLQSIIPSVLTFGVLGYPFVLPDMIGGNAYSDLDTFGGGAYPDRELYIRWLQLNSLLPALQFSVAPWIYDDEVISLTHKSLATREKYMDRIVSLAKESVETGRPIIRPLWWVSPGDEVALVTGDEFLVGDDLLVAPVVEEGGRKRDVYLPHGRWRDMLVDKVVEGPVWLRDYPAALNQLPHFEREE